MSRKTATSSAMTLPFDKFWAWLQAHANCIVRAGTPDTVLFDHDDYHWHLVAEDESLYVVQLVRGKELVGEMIVLASDISYVVYDGAETEEVAFDCIIENEAAREAVYHFVVAHGYEEVEAPSTRRWAH